MLPHKMPHLAGAKRLPHRQGQNLCFHEAAGFVLDVPGSTFAVATFRASTPEELARIPNASPVAFVHAWAEWRGLMWSPTAMRSGPIDDYLRVNGATDVKRLARPALLRVAAGIGLSRHLRLGVPPKASVGASLLAAAGKRFRVADGAILPEEEAAS